MAEGDVAIEIHPFGIIAASPIDEEYPDFGSLVNLHG